MADVRKWLPAEWADEIVPDMEASPDAYIEREGEGWGLRLPVGNASRSDDHEEDCWHTKIEPGRVVNFMWTESYGTFDLTVNDDDDRTWSTDRPIPATASHFWLPFDVDTLADSVDELVREAALDPGEYTMGAYHWSDYVPFRFEVDADGAGRFVSCAGAN
jgi:hypothetical protein